MGCWTLTQARTRVTTQVEGIGAPAEREPMRLKVNQLEGLIARSGLEADPEAIAVGLGRKLESRHLVKELGSAERMDPRRVLLDKQCSQVGTTRSWGTASQPAVDDDAAAAAEVSGQRFGGPVISIAVVSAVEGSYDR